MTRKEFLSLCGASCIGLMGMSLLAEASPLQVAAKGEEDRVKKACRLTIEKEAFVRKRKKDKVKYRSYLTVKEEGMDYPVIVYRFEEGGYAALLMRCSHQGNELTAFGDILSCSAHGSEFDRQGNVLQGPADMPLQTYAVEEDENNIYINIA